jgi:MIP family channel proteins
MTTDRTTGARSLADGGPPATRPEASGPNADAAERPSLAGSALAEFLGTFMLLFFGVGTVLAIGGAETAANKLTIGFGFGLAILAAAYTFGHVSGAHLNPAVTIGFLLTRGLPVPAAVAYVVAQLAGAVLGVLAVDAVLGDFNAIDISVTVPGEPISDLQALLAEFILGFVLMLVVKGTATDDRSESPSAGMAIGFTIVLGHLALIPVSGSSFNPARSFGSAVVAGNFDGFWLYVVGPVAGAVAAALLYDGFLRKVRPPEVGDVAA